MKSRQRSYTFPSDFSQFTNLYKAIAQIGKELGFSVEDQFRFALCISEAYTNAFLHGNAHNPEKSIHVRFSWDQKLLRTDIEDEGQPLLSAFDVEGASPAIEPDRDNGRGIGIIKNYADRVEIEQREEGGMRVSIFWQLTNRSTNPVAR
jgi:anti-sigma regulatory factor (Ser/Thr protein kinase)